MTEYTKKIEAVDSMSDTNLFITMLNGVTNGRLTETEAYDMARKMIKYSSFFTRIDTASVSEFMDFGLEEHEAVALVSMAEILRRSLVRKAERETIFSSESLGKRLIAQIGCREQEHLMAFYLDTQNKVIDERVISIGSNKRSIASPADILRYAVRCNASSIIVAHNHPSGEVRPSNQDREFTRTLFDAAKLFEIVLLDHLVIGRDDYYSFRERDYILD